MEYRYLLATPHPLTLAGARSDTHLFLKNRGAFSQLSFEPLATHLSDITLRVRESIDPQNLLPYLSTHVHLHVHMDLVRHSYWQGCDTSA